MRKIKKNSMLTPMYMRWPICGFWLFLSVAVMAQSVDVEKLKSGRLPSSLTNLPSSIPTQIRSIEKKKWVDPAKAKQTSAKALKAAFTDPIELMYNNRYGVELGQYGYDFFGHQFEEQVYLAGDDYRVGPGDTIALYFWGDPVDILNLPSFYNLEIDRSGKIFIPNIGAFYVAGLSLATIKDTIQKAVAKKYKRFSFEVTVGNLRTFPLYVSGYVNNPGFVQVTGMNTVLDALTLAGGVSKNGSLRKITINREVPDGKSEKVNLDLYDFLVFGQKVDLRLRQGDTIYVAEIQKTVAISGLVKRPAIYEFAGTDIRFGKIFDYAGGTLPSVYTASVKLFRVENNEIVLSDKKLNDPAFLEMSVQDGDYLKVETLHNEFSNVVEVSGSLGYPGSYPFRPGLKMSQLLPRIGLQAGTNTAQAEIKREGRQNVITFSPDEVLSGKVDIDLENRDEIFFFPKFVYKPILVSGLVKETKFIPYYNGITLLQVVRDLEYTKSARVLKAVIITDSEIFEKVQEASQTNTEGVSDNDSQDDTLSDLLKKNLKVVYLKDLLYKASEEDNLRLLPGSRILIQDTQDTEKRRSFTILGEVKKPGTYQITETMRLYDAIKQGGGYTKNAYPRGLIFSRENARKLQQSKINIAFLSMEEYMADRSGAVTQAAATAEEQAALGMVLTGFQQSLNVLQRKSKLALGRIALEIPESLDDLKSSAENIIIDDEDYIFIPPQPHYVLVIGDVFNQISLPYQPGNTVSYYINQVGGMTESAHEENIYVIRANGKIISKQQYSSNYDIFFKMDWRANQRIVYARDFDNIELSQGDTVVIPKEIEVPIIWRVLIKDVTQIAFQAMSTAALAQRL